MSNLFSLNIKDWSKGLVTAILAAVFTWLAMAMKAPGFNYTTIDWAEIMRIALAAGAAYVGKNFLSDSDGKVLGHIG